ncbi:MAG TPA: tetratricopeptide repeat protein, partial [Amycolatopsis sp.]|nr:tetratricopeptide repeat protein [Amycolatopsis sp.]
MAALRSRVDRAVTAADALYQRAREAAKDHGPANAARLLQKSLRRLDEAPAESPEWLAVRARVLISLASADAEITSLKAGLAHLTKARAVLSRMPPGDERGELEVVVELQHAVVLFRAGRLGDALALFNAVLPALDRDSPDNRLRFTVNLMNRAYVHLRMSNPEAALADLNRCLDLAVANGHRQLEGKVRHNLGDRALLVGDIPEALRHYEDAARIFEVEGPGSLPIVRLDQARALLAAGRGEEASRHLDEALPKLRANRVLQDVAEAEVARAAAASLEGDYGTARQFASAARRRFLRRGNQRWAEVAALAKLRADATQTLDGT